MASLWERLSGGTRGRHEPIASRDEHEDDDQELEAAFAGPIALAGSDEARPSPHASTLDRPYDTSPPSTPQESHPLDSTNNSWRSQHGRSHSSSSSSSSTADSYTSAAPAYDFELNPSQLRTAPSSAVDHPSTSIDLPSRAASANRAGQLRQLLSRGFTGLARYGRLSTADPDVRYARASSGANDGVFANLSAKPEARPRNADGSVDWVGGDDEGNSKEVPPVRFIAVKKNWPVCAPVAHACAFLSLLPLELRCRRTRHHAPVLGDHHHRAHRLYGPRRGACRRFAHRQHLCLRMEYARQHVLPIRWLPPHLCECCPGSVPTTFRVQANSLFPLFFFQLLHTSHAAKHGSRAGLGITLIQYALYLRSRAQTLQNELDKGQIPPELVGAFPVNATDPNAPFRLRLPGHEAPGQGGLFGGPAMEHASTAVSGTSATPTASMQAAPSMLSGLPELQREGLEQAMEMSSMANDWLSYMLMFIGWALLVGAFLSYWKAWRWAKRIRGETAPTAAAAAPEEPPPEVVFARDAEIENSLRRAGLM